MKYRNFDVEYADKGDDIIYHFWPKDDLATFLPHFAMALQDGFRSTVPPDADVRAEFTSAQEAMVLARHSEVPLHLDKESRSLQDVKWIPRETYFVRVVGGLQYPLADVFLKMRVFANIEKAIAERNK